MAVVGSAQIIVRAITTDVARDIERGIKGAEGAVNTAGQQAGRRFSKAFSGSQGSFFQKLSQGLKSIAPEADAAGEAWKRLQKTGFVLQTAVGVLAGSLAALGGGLVALGGAIGGAIPAALTLVGVLGQLKIASALANFALGGIGAAAQQLSEGGGAAARSLVNELRAVEDAQRKLRNVIEENARKLEDANEDVADSQNKLNKAIREGREELQQLGFEAEDAALAEKRAALELERARETLARVQDLPPNSRARRDAELAFAEADLNLRKAIDANKDLAKEQERIGGDINNLEGVIDAEKDLADAIEDRNDTERENAERLEDANRDLRRAKEDLAAAQAQLGGSNPLAGLTASQANFAQFLASIKPLLDELRESVASGFLPVLETQIKRIISAGFPTLKQGFTEVGIALGTFTTRLTDSIVDPKNIERLGGLFTSTAYTVSQAGYIAGDAWEILLIIMEELDPLIRSFMDFLVSRVDAFKNFLNVEQESGRLTAFFTRSKEILGDLSEVFGNVFNGLGDIIMANFQPGSGGDMMIQWLKSATAGFAALGDDSAGLQEFFRGAAGNSISIFQSIGALIKEIIGLGAMPEIGMFWDTLKEGAPYVGEILRNGILAGPSLANLLVNITRIVAAFADAGAPKAFFDTLAFAAGIVANILENELVKSILDFIGPITGTIMALTTLTGIAKGLGFVVAFMVKAFLNLNPIVRIITIIVGLFIALYNSNEEFASSMDSVWASLQPTFALLAETFGGLLTALTPVFSQLIEILATALVPVIVLIAETFADLVPKILPVITTIIDAIVKLIPIFMSIVEALLPVFETIIEAISQLLPVIIDSLVPVFMMIVDAVIPIVNILLDTLVPVIAQLIQTLAPLISQIIGAVVPAFMAIIQAVMPVITMLLGILIPIISTLIKIIVIVATTIIQILAAAFKFIAPIITGFITIIMGIVTTIVNFVTPVIKGLVGIFTTVFTAIGNGIKGIINGIIGIFEGFVNGIIGGVNFIVDAINRIKFTAPAWVPFIGGKTMGFSLPRIATIRLPRLAEGGTVRATSGGMLAQIAEAGRDERVEPLDSSGLSTRDRAMIELLSNKQSNPESENNISINVYPSEGMNERELASKISRVLALQLRRGSVT
jgi:phage-related protein